MSEKFCLSVTYNDSKRYERNFDKLTDIPPFIKENFLKYGIASIVFADDMSEVENTDFEELFKNILEENDSETMALYEKHIEIWNSLTDTEKGIEKVTHKFNEFYSKELAGEPKLKVNIKEAICNEL